MLVAFIPTRQLSRGCKAKVILACIFLFIISLALAAAAYSPTDVVKSGTDKVLHILKEQSASTHGRRSKIRQVVNDYFDFADMGKRALGMHWKELSAQQRQEYVSSFSQFLFDAYIGKIEKYTDETLAYRQKGERGGSSVVEAVITGGQADRIVIDYRLHEAGGGWKVYDVVIEGVGLVSNYRAQFDAILSKGSVEDLLRQLKEKNARNS